VAKKKVVINNATDAKVILNDTINALLNGKISAQDAKCIFYGLQIALSCLKAEATTETDEGSSIDVLVAMLQEERAARRTKEDAQGQAIQ
jgi:hypothetical protein